MSLYAEEQAAYIAGVLEAEAALKEYEHAGSETVTPCINELRYAAKHVADALQAEKEGEDSETIREHWSRAIRHTQRAKYDVLEFHVELVKLKVAEAIESYAGYSQIAAKLIPRYYEHKKALYELTRNFQEISDCNKDSEEYVSCCKRHIKVADAFMQDFLIAEEELMLSIEKERMSQEEQKTEKKEDRKIAWLQCLTSAVLSCLLTGLVSYIIYLITR